MANPLGRCDPDKSDLNQSLFYKMSISFSVVKDSNETDVSLIPSSHPEPEPVGWATDRFVMIPEEVTCPLCTHVCRDAMALNCGHSFCQACIVKSEDHFKNICPICKLFISQLVPDFAKRMKINGLFVSCRYKKEGCSCTDAVSRIGPHEYLCGYEPIVCTVCEAKVCRNQMQQHQQETCPYRLQVCPSCSKKVPYCTMTDHLRYKCPSIEMVCRYCTWTGLRGKQPEHNATCPLFPIECPYARYGCTEIVPRNSMDTHTMNVTHIPLLYQAIQEREQAWVLARPDGPFLVGCHKHPVILCADVTEPCSLCQKALVPENNRTFVYRCTQGCEYHLCNTCMISQRTYKIKSNVTVPNYFFSFLHQ